MDHLEHLSMALQGVMEAKGPDAMQGKGVKHILTSQALGLHALMVALAHLQYAPSQAWLKRCYQVSVACTALRAGRSRDRVGLVGGAAQARVLFANTPTCYLCTRQRSYSWSPDDT
jgi:hypothetical protein